MNKDNQKQTSNIKTQVMDKIKSGKTHMHSRLYYIFLGLFSVTSIILLSVSAIYFSSVASLWVRITTSQGPAYGARQNLETLISTFPWWSLLLGLVSLVAVIFLIKKLGRFYKVRLIYLITAVISLFILVGFIASYSNLPNILNNRGPNQTQNTNSSSGKKYQFGK